jgi:hypothetical protein|tara:strand:- start:104 stop:943 length:840 start_codon:yes stop_codon:yes gene_type:complete
MKGKLLFWIMLFFQIFSMHNPTWTYAKYNRFDVKKDLLLVHFDCKTDVDDIQTMAAFATILSNPIYANINYYAVTGTYGVQEGLYAQPNELLDLAFKNHWTDAHNNFTIAVMDVMLRLKPVLDLGGDIWIADAGQSDFTSEIIQAIKLNYPNIITSDHIHVIQHSDWNESVTSPLALQFVKNNSDYNKIPDGNGLGNGSPGFKDSNFTYWDKLISDPELLNIWQLAIVLSNQYNGKEGRYLNEAIASGGLDFSDLSEICWILGLEDITDIDDFFSRFLN